MGGSWQVGRIGRKAYNDVEAIKADTDALQKAFYPIAEKIYREQAAQNQQAQGGASADGNYYDAGFEDKTNG